MAGMRKAAGGKPIRAMLAAGSGLAIDGVPWIEVLAGAPASIEVEPTSTGVAISGEGGDAMRVRVLAPSATVVTFNGVEVPFDRDGDHVIIPKEGSTLGDAGDAGSGSDVGTDGAAADARDLEGGGGAEGESSNGCGCAIPGGSRDAASSWGLAAIGAVVWVRRRRRACYGPRSRAHR